MARLKTKKSDLEAGRKANSNGTKGERAVIKELARFVSDVIDHRTDYEGNERDYRGASVIIRNAPYTKYTGVTGRGDILWLLPDGYKHRFEVRVQNTQGTVEEKLPALAENCDGMPEPATVVLDGDGFSFAAIKDLKKRCRKHKPRTSVVYLDELRPLAKKIYDRHSR